MLENATENPQINSEVLISGVQYLVPTRAVPSLRRSGARSPWPRLGEKHQAISGPATGKRERVMRKAHGKLTLWVNFGGSWHELTCLVTHFSFPILGYPFQGH